MTNVVEDPQLREKFHHERGVVYQLININPKKVQNCLADSRQFSEVSTWRSGVGEFQDFLEINCFPDFYDPNFNDFLYTSTKILSVRRILPT